MKERSKEGWHSATQTNSDVNDGQFKNHSEKSTESRSLTIQLLWLTTFGFHDQK